MSDRFEITFHRDGGFAVQELIPTWSLDRKRMLTNRDKRNWCAEMRERLDQYEEWLREND